MNYKEKLAAIEKKFNETQAQKDALDKELYRLQGEYRLCQEVMKAEDQEAAEEMEELVKD